MFIASILLSLGFTLIIIPNGLVSLSAQQVDWKNYTSDKLQISFEYPSDWTLTEKANRFDQGAEITVHKDQDYFFVMEPSPGPYVMNFETVVSVYYQGLLLNGVSKNIDIIEGPIFDKYIIDNKPTASILFVIDSLGGERGVREAIKINEGNKLQDIIFESSPSDFDLLENQNIRNHIINTFKFLS